jgi:hypothetical protein
MVVVAAAAAVAVLFAGSYHGTAAGDRNSHASHITAASWSMYSADNPLIALV